MAEPKSEKTAPPVAASAASSGAPRGDGPAMHDLQNLAEILRAHGEAIGVAMGAAIGQKLNELKQELSGRQRASAEDPEAWLARCTPGERKHLKKLDEELKTLEKTLEGPQDLLETKDGSGQPVATGEARWQLPRYEPVERDSD